MLVVLAVVLSIIIIILVPVFSTPRTATGTDLTFIIADKDEFKVNKTDVKISGGSDKIFVVRDPQDRAAEGNLVAVERPRLLGEQERWELPATTLTTRGGTIEALENVTLRLEAETPVSLTIPIRSELVAERVSLAILAAMVFLLLCALLVLSL
jgi:hypothetical protein